MRLLDINIVGLCVGVGVLGGGVVPYVQRARDMAHYV